MGDLGNNPAWSNLEQASTSMIGPDYSYSSHVPSPSSLGVGSNGTFRQIYTNSAAASTYIKGLISGDPPLGNRFFINTAGTCTAPDGSVQPRYNYINNIPGGGTSAGGTKDLPFLSNDMRGLIPGIVEDISGLNPYYLFNAMREDASPPCECYTCEVTSGGASYFLTTSLSPDYNPAFCKKADTSVCLPKEKFTNQLDSTMFSTFVAVCVLAYLAMK
jgi:hypothetical protein